MRAIISHRDNNAPRHANVQLGRVDAVGRVDDTAAEDDEVELRHLEQVDVRRHPVQLQQMSGGPAARVFTLFLIYRAKLRIS